MPALLGLALVLRLYLVARGGALYWTDEKRYLDSREAVAALAVGDGTSAAWYLLSRSDHLGFRWLALLPATVERAGYGTTPPHARVAAGFFALFGVLNLYLVWRIARKVSPDDSGGQAALALALACASNALLYFARHCFPYDAALTCFLLAALVTVPPEGTQRAWLAGLWCGLGYLLYNGYWSVGAAVLLVFVARPAVPLRARFRSAALALLGLATPVAAALGAARLAGYDLLAHARRFAGTVNQGDFGEGWRFVGEYLWAADGLLAAGLGALVVLGMAFAARRRVCPPWLRWSAVVAVLLGLWLLCSDVTHTFVLYGRTVRALVPFLALAAAGATTLLWQHAGRVGRAALAGGVALACMGGLWSMRQPLAQRFPAEFRAMAEEAIRADRLQSPGATYRVLFADYLFDYDFPPAPPPHREVLRRTHPHRYAPYLFEGYTREQRPRYLGHDTAMRVIALDSPPEPARLPPPDATSPPLGGEPFGRAHGPIELRFTLPAQPRHPTELLLTTGEFGAADFLTITYQDSNYVRLALDHWGGDGLVSPPLPVTPGAVQRLVVSLGPLCPDLDDPVYHTDPGTRFLPGWLYVRLNDHVVFSQPFPLYPARLDSLTLGASRVGGTFAGAPFSGTLLSAQRRPPRELGLTAEALVWPPTSGPRRPDGYLGALALTLTLPTRWDPGIEPLIATGDFPASDIVFIKYGGGGRSLQLGYRHGLGAYVWSRPIRTSPGASHRLEVSMPSLFPPGAPESARPVRIGLDGVGLLTVEQPGHPAAPDAVGLGTAYRDIKGSRVRFSGKLDALERLPGN